LARTNHVATTIRLIATALGPWPQWQIRDQIGNDLVRIAFLLGCRGRHQRDFDRLPDIPVPWKASERIVRLGGVRLRTNEAMANRSLRWLSGRGKTSVPASQSRQCRCLPVVNSPQSLFRTYSSPRRAVGGKSLRGSAGHKLMSPYVRTPLGRRSRRHLTVAAIPSRIPSKQPLDVKPLPPKGWAPAPGLSQVWLVTASPALGAFWSGRGAMRPDAKDMDTGKRPPITHCRMLSGCSSSIGRL
jgi:hypothetical protein